MAKTQKSPNFDRNLDGSAMVKQVYKNLYLVGSTAGENSNKIAPLDSGKLRNSLRIFPEVNKVRLVWTVPYANVRYYNNKKNPQTKEWAKKDYTKNGSKYIKILSKGVIK